MNLNEMVMNSLGKMSESGKVQEIIDKKVESTIASVVDDLFGSWSDFSKDLKSQVKESLNINFDKLDLATYNHMLLQVIKDKLDDEIATQGINKIKGQVEGLLSDSKKEYKLSELIKELAEEVENLDELGYEEYHEMSLHVKNPYGSWWISFDSRTDIEEYNCKYRLHVDEKGKVYSITINDGNKTRSIDEFDAKVIMSGLYNLDETLFKLYVNGAKLIIDENDCELDISNPEYD